MKSFLTTLLLLSILGIQAQSPQPPATSAEDRLAGFEQRRQLMDASLVAKVPFQSVGPTIFSGRIVDLAVNPQDPTIFYVAYASGGLWKTVNNGNSFTPIFDHEMVMTIGDIEVDWTNEVIWVGTGENNSSRSSYSGVGMYKSTDDGQTWQYLGLPESHHIGRIILHPTNPNTVWVGVLGHLYSPNKERGVYKTTDGGKSWTQSLFVNENSGVIDLVIDPQDPNTLYAATWEKTRRAWDFVESGNGTGIHKTVDGGTNWTRMTTEKSGFPTGKGAGRIGLDITQSGKKTVLFAVIDNYDRRPEEEEQEGEELSKDDFREISKEDFLAIEEKDLESFLRSNRFPRAYSATKVRAMVEDGSIQPNALTEYLEDANSLLFDTPVIGAEVYRSDNGGKKWKKTHEEFLDDLFYSYGYYFGQIRVSHRDVNKLYVLGVPMVRSDDGGAKWKSLNSENAHGDHHALWVSPKRDGHLILGNDGGLNISYDDGETWFKCNSPAVGQFYTVNVDMAKPYHIYGGLQDNGVWEGPKTYEHSRRWHSNGKYPYQSILGGDGMQVEIDTRDNETVYTGFQFGNYFRIHKTKGSRKRITPRHELGERPLRWNWQSPIHLSRHNQDILYMGANKLFRSFDQGDHFEAISEDLTNGGRKGDVAFGTLATIHESPLKFGLIYTGSDDGFIHVSEDGGHSWDRVSDDLPKDMWISRVQASAHKEGRVFVSLNGYRWDDFSAYVYRSEDYGRNWTRIGTNLPAEPVNVIKEDPVNPELLYVGTDHGTYISLNMGATFMAIGSKVPATPVHDLVIHTRDKELILGTHGRSFYVADISPLQQMTAEFLASSLHLFELEAIQNSGFWGRQFSTWREPFDPEIDLTCYAKAGGEAMLSLADSEGNVLKEWSETLSKGLNYFTYDLSIPEDAAQSLYKPKEGEKEKLDAADNEKYYLPVGNYIIRLKQGEASTETNLKIKK
ncbi:MAG: glycosyl hydrolase [Bacteroidota bacterium]